MKKKYLDLAFAYAIAAMVAGVFYREFTKWMGFTGTTALGKVHTHLFFLGMLVFLVIALASQTLDLEGEKLFRLFMQVYNLGLPILSLTLLGRGIFQVVGTELSHAANSVISGIAGVGHILVGTGLVLFLLSLKKQAEE